MGLPHFSCTKMPTAPTHSGNPPSSVRRGRQVGWPSRQSLRRQQRELQHMTTHHRRDEPTGYMAAGAGWTSHATPTILRLICLLGSDSRQHITFPAIHSSPPEITLVGDRSRLRRRQARVALWRYGTHHLPRQHVASSLHRLLQIDHHWRRARPCRRDRPVPFSPIEASR